MKKKKRRSFATTSKRILYAVLIWGMALVTISFVLAVFNLPTNENLAIAIVGSLIVALIGYFAKSAFEKDSVNKHGAKQIPDGNDIEGEGDEQI